MSRRARAAVGRPRRRLGPGAGLAAIAVTLLTGVPSPATAAMSLDVTRLAGVPTAATPATPQDPAPGRADGTMYTERRHIYTTAGERVVLRGVNEMFAWAEEPRGAWVLGEIAKTGANAVRIVTTTDFAAADLDAVIGNAVSAGLIPIPECHSATGRWDRLPACVDYWTRPEIARVIQSHEAWVLLNIANEAGDDSVTTDQFVDGYRSAITRIRAAGIRTPLIIDGASWGQEHRMLLDTWPALDAHDPRHAIIASAHTYWVGTEEERKDHYRAIIETVTRREIPFIVGEGPTPSGWDCTPSPYEWALDELEAHEIGWLAWSWGVVDNGDCDDPVRYDMTRGGRFGDWETEAGRVLAVDHPASIRNTSRRPCSISNAGADCVRPTDFTADRPDQDGAVAVTGPAMQYHPLTLTFRGPDAAESGDPNPFRDYRLTVTFRHEATGDELRVPGYFAADGDAAETGATEGDRWRVHVTPHAPGAWTYRASFRTGEDVALSLSETAGRPTAFDDATGRFVVAATDKSGRDFRGKGMLRYVGEHHLRFDNGDWFVKGGTDSPETLLAYADFDGTRSLAAPGEQRQGEAATAGLKRYEPHLRDWRDGDPTWRDGRGKGLIGALNYLASEGLNAVSFLTMNVGGDGRNVWPWVEPDVRDRYDVSKLAQWERVFGHADSLGLYLHFKTQETENDLLLDGGELGPERRLYYRELIARFGHHLALNWNLGEENDIWEELDDPRQHRVRAYAEWIRDLDPYDHHIVIHSYPWQHAEVYVPLLGERSALTGISLQTNWDEVHEDTRLWRVASRAAGRKWVVANDEQGDASTGLTPDGPESNHDALRHRTLWGNLMAGGAGVEFYFGYDYPHNDLDAEDFRSRDRFWDYVRHALHFFDAYLPYWRMEGRDDLADWRHYVLARPGEVYAVYVADGGEVGLRLDEAGTYSVRWYDPRNGGPLQAGTVEQVSGGRTVSLGRPPADDGQDRVVLVRRVSVGTSPSPPAAPGAGR